MVAAILTLCAAGLLFGAGLAFASRVLAVKQDERLEAILEILPSANCGGCGYAGCSSFGEAVLKGEADPTGCPVGGQHTTQEIARIIGVEVETPREKNVAKVLCRGTREAAKSAFNYVGPRDCRAAAMVSGGPKACRYGCLGLGTCVEVCQFDAIYMSPEGLPVVDYERCTACGKCVQVCPRDILQIVPLGKPVVACRHPGKVREVRGVCSNGCLGCGLCVRVCPEEARFMEDNLGKVDYDKCARCPECISAEKCPTKVIEPPPIEAPDLTEEKRAG